MNVASGTVREGRHGHRSALDRRPYGFIFAAVVVLAAREATYAFTDAQVQSGERVYQHSCTRCHGPNADGKDEAYRGLRAPELIGSTALPCTPRPFQKIRQHAFRSVRDVYEFVSAAMPADRPASLEAEQYWDVLAFLLQHNGIPADGEHLDDASGAQVTLHTDCTPAAVLANGTRP